MRLEIYIRLDFLTSNFRLFSTDTVYWSGVRIVASRLLLLLLLFFVSRKDRTNDLWKHLFANIIWKYSSLVWLGNGMLLILFYFFLFVGPLASSPLNPSSPRYLKIKSEVQPGIVMPWVISLKVFLAAVCWNAKLPLIWIQEPGSWKLGVSQSEKVGHCFREGLIQWHSEPQNHLDCKVWWLLSLENILRRKGSYPAR